MPLFPPPPVKPRTRAPAPCPCSRFRQDEKQRDSPIEPAKLNRILKEKKTDRDATRVLPRGSPILVLLSPKHAQLRSSDGIRWVSDSMITSVISSTPNSIMLLSPPPPVTPRTRAPVPCPRSRFRQDEKQRDSPIEPAKLN